MGSSNKDRWRSPLHLRRIADGSNFRRRSALPREGLLIDSCILRGTLTAQ
ncbi:hypothetical protein [Oscillatoria sp. HE19RPO]|nr:hypothetical protein [Oscillatoria sp. HE19RPO]